MAQKKYVVPFNGAAAAAPMCEGAVTCTAAARGRISDLLVGPGPVAPVDQAVQMTVKRTTANSSGGSAVTPAAIDANEVAAVCGARSADTTNGTATTPALLQFGLNMRATFRWVAAPDYELIGTAGAATGLSVEKTAESAANQQNYGTIMFFE